MINKFIQNPKFIEVINTITKFPSIETYHELGDRGILKDNLNFPDKFNNYVLQEKVDGRNCRIILLSPDKYFIGSREDLLWCSNDILFTRSNGIVETIQSLNLAPKFEKLFGNSEISTSSHIWIIYGEAYGGNTKQDHIYTHSGQVGFNIFMISHIRWTDIAGLMDLNIEAIAALRDRNPITYFSYDKPRINQPLNVKDTMIRAKIMRIDTVPVIEYGGPLPISHQDTYGFLNELSSKTAAGLDNHGRAEGIVIKNIDNSCTAKIRFQNYERVLKIKKI